tara:strand:- start:29 stop:319 length:291 start_codon:yes stop_codon:yes gene_type:complete
MSNTSPLVNFISSNNIDVTKTKKLSGLMIYKPSQVNDLEKLTQLVEDIGWKVIVSEDRFDPQSGKKIKGAIYLGPAKSELDITSKEDLSSYLASLV